LGRGLPEFVAVVEDLLGRAAQPSGWAALSTESFYRSLVGPGVGAGANQGPQLLRPVRVAPGPACVSRIERLGADQTELDVLPVGLRHTAWAVGPAAVQRRARVVVLSREDADRVRVCRASGRLAIAGDLTGEGRASTCTCDGDCAQRSRKHRLLPQHGSLPFRSCLPPAARDVTKGGGTSQRRGAANEVQTNPKERPGAEAPGPLRRGLRAARALPLFLALPQLGQVTRPVQ